MASNPQQTFFHNAKDFVINGGNFTNVSNAERTEKAFQSLLKHVATTAFHDSIQRCDPPRCHENTREAILEELFDWIIGNIPRETWIAWLNGAAGAGKSAICQSLAELCILRGVIVASFFFFRTDPTRNTIDHLIPTLAYQIIQQVPETKDFIVRAIETNPLIFGQSVETQFNTLIVEPLRRLSVLDPNRRKMIVIVDGVDECQGSDNQVKIIKAIAKIFQSPNLPLTILFASRCEYDLRMAFDSSAVKPVLCQFSLDEKYNAEQDIRRFLNDKFGYIKRSHPFRKNLGEDWPLPSHVQEIVGKSSGHFIYASIVIDFLSIPNSSPASQLEIVRGLRLNPAGRRGPFSQLDALYRHMFSCLVDLEAALEILAFTILARQSLFERTRYFLRLTKEDTKYILAPLASVLGDLDEDHLTFRHASLPDFLCDEGRSQKYCVNRLNTRLSILWLDNLASGRYANFVCYQFSDICQHLARAEATTELQEKLLEYTPSKQDSAFFLKPGAYYYPTQLLTVVRQLFGESHKAYKYLLDKIVHYVKEEFPKNTGALKHFTKLERPLSAEALPDSVSSKGNVHNITPAPYFFGSPIYNRISRIWYTERMEDQKQASGFSRNSDRTAILRSTFRKGTGAEAEADPDGFRLLRELVAVSAFGNANEHFEILHFPPRTNRPDHDAVTQALFEWIVDEAPRTTWITWLNGRVGSGKSAVCQSMVELCMLRSIPVASFIFSHTDTTRNQCDALVATLAYQITQVFPQLKRPITQAIKSNPFIFANSLEAQFNVLIIEPIRCLPASDSIWKLIFVLDGVDECLRPDEQTKLIQTIAKILQPRDLPLIFLFSSRVEHDILKAFRAPIFDSILSHHSLEINKPQRFIHSLLTKGFMEIKQTHPFKHILGSDWPTPSTIQDIVDQSSGKDSYADAVIRFLSLPKSHPANQLAIVRNLRLDPSAQRTCFAQLDVLYQHIFAQLVDLQAVLDILAYSIFIKPWPYKIQATWQFFQMTKEDMQNMLAPLAPVLGIDEDTMEFRDDSRLPGFICDRARSQQYCVSMSPTRLCRLWLKNLAAGYYTNLSPLIIYTLIIDLLEYTTVSVEQEKEIRTIRGHMIYPWYTDKSLNDFLSEICKIMHYVNKLPPCDFEDIAEYDISQVLAKMESNERAAEAHQAVVLEALPFNAELDWDSTSSISEDTHSLRASARSPNIFKVRQQQKVAESPSRSRTPAHVPGSSTLRKIPASRTSDAALRAPNLAGSRRVYSAQAAPASSRPDTALQATLGPRVRTPVIRTPPSKREISTVRGTPSNIRARGLASRIPSASLRSPTRPTARAIAGESSRAADAKAEKASSSTPPASGRSGVNRNRAADGASPAPTKGKSVSAAEGDARTPVKVRRQGVGKSVEAKVVARGGPATSPSSKKPAWK